MEYDVSEILAAGTLKVLPSKEAIRKGYVHSHELVISEVMSLNCK